MTRHTNSLATTVAREASASRPTPESVLYILGPSYSGSTLLTFLLAQHPQIATIGELKAATVGRIPDYRCSCGQLLRECALWRDVQARMRRRGFELELSDLGTHISGHGRLFRRLINAGVRPFPWPALSDSAIKLLPRCRRTLAGVLQQNFRLMETIAEAQQGRVFLDGSKDPERLRMLLRGLSLPVKVVRLLRDGRGVTNSYMKHYRVGMKVAAKEFLRTSRACDRVMARIGAADQLTIRYEDLCREPQETVASVLALARLAPTAARMRRAAGAIHILGNAMRLDSAVEIRLDENWRRELSSSDLETFSRTVRAYDHRSAAPKLEHIVGGDKYGILPAAN
jgi:hypothetical protein